VQDGSNGFISPFCACAARSSQTAPPQTDLADGALELNDTLLAAVGADYAASGDLQVCGQSAENQVISQCTRQCASSCSGCRRSRPGYMP